MNLLELMYLTKEAAMQNPGVKQAPFRPNQAQKLQQMPFRPNQRPKVDLTPFKSQKPMPRVTPAIPNQKPKLPSGPVYKA